MIRNGFKMVGLMLLAAACTSPKADTEEVVEENFNEPIVVRGIDYSLIENKPNETFAIDSFLGYYSGDFRAIKFNAEKNPMWLNKITFHFEKVAGDSVFGRSIVAGNIRPFEGIWTLEDDEINMNLAEPGDDKYDGVFSFAYDKTNQKINGTWTANDSNLAVYERKYDLGKKEFRYDKDLDLPSDMEWADISVILKTFFNKDSSEQFEYEMGEFLTEDVTKINASSHKLTAADVENMYKGDLEVMRNSIYARHGYTFRNRKMRTVFNMVDWYMPMYNDVSNELTPVEEENIALIKRYEEHSERYYDEFGR
jgi:hypothetical protein